MGPRIGERVAVRTALAGAPGSGAGVDAVETSTTRGIKPSGNGPHQLVVSGDCLSATRGLVYQLINQGSAGGRLRTVKVTQSATKTNTSDNFTGCGK